MFLFKIRVRKYLQNVPLVSSLVVFGIIAIFYLVIFDRNTPSDVQLHVEFAMKMAKGEAFIGNFLFYLLVIILSFGCISFKIAFLAAIFLIVFAVALKYFFTQKIILRSITNFDLVLGTKVLNKNYFIAFLSFILIISSVINLPGNLITKYFIIGQFPPNVWHNSTVIFLMPFALLLFYESFELLNDFSRKKLITVCVLVLLNILIKPSFLFCFIIIYPLIIFEKYFFKKQFWILMIPVFIGLVLIIVQYILNYVFQKELNIPNESGIKIAPFNVWSSMSDNYLVSLVLSIGYPLSFLMFYFKRSITDLTMKYAIALFLAALFIMIFISETGVREFHGNFIWQVIVCNYILFVVTLISHLKIILIRKSLELKDKIIGIVLLLHFAGGVLYLLKLLILKDYR